MTDRSEVAREAAERAWSEVYAPHIEGMRSGLADIVNHHRKSMFIAGYLAGWAAREREGKNDE